MRESDQRVRRAQAAGRAGLTGVDLPHGCVVVGPPQSGRSTALASLQESWPADAIRLSGIGRTPERVFGEVVARPPRGDLRWELGRAFAAMPNPVLFVDDADLLDDRAAALLHALVVHDRVPIFLTCVAETSRRSPRGVSALWRDGNLPRFDLREMTLAEAGEFVRVRLGAVPEIQDVADLLAQSGGRTAVFVELVEASIADSCWRSAPGVMLMTRSPSVTGRLREALVGDEDLAPREQAALVTLAAAAPEAAAHTGGWVRLSALLALHDLDVLVDLERRGLVESRARHIRLALPAVGETIRSATTASALTVAALELGRMISPAGLAGLEAARADLLHVLLVRGGGGSVTADAMVAAARGALRLGDPHTVIAVLDAEPDLVRDRRDVAALSANAALHLGDPAQFMARMDRCDDPADPAWATLIAVTADQLNWNTAGPVEYLRTHGDTEKSVTADIAQVQRTDAVVAAWRGLNCGVAAALQGREALARAAWSVVSGQDYEDAFLSIYLECAELMASVLIGDAAGAGAAADRFLERHRWRSARAREVIGFIAGLVYLEVGRIADADAQLGKGQRWWESDESGATPALAESLSTRRRAWRLVEQGQRAQALTLLADAAAALDRGAIATAAEYLELRLRFTDGRTDVDDAQIAALQTSASARTGLVVAYAHARSSDDPAALDAVGDRYAAAGRLPTAADIAAQAGAAHLRRGRRRAAAVSARTARDRCVLMPGFSSPAQRLPAAPVTLLSRREQQIAALAATSTNKEIADRLGLSVRTVEGHILRACTKTGARDRTALAEYVEGTAQ